MSNFLNQEVLLTALHETLKCNSWMSKLTLPGKTIADIKYQTEPPADVWDAVVRLKITKVLKSA